jgi:hypothetical protein
MRCKNPLSPLWSRDVVGDRLYSLDELAAGLKLDVTDAELETGRSPDIARSPEIVVDPQSGSNALFVALRDFGRQHAPQRRQEGASIEEWRHELVTLALTLHDDERHAARTAIRVADYTWSRAVPRQRLADDERRRRYAEGGRSTAAGQRSKSVTAVVDAWRRLVALGQAEPTAAALAKESGKSERTVWRCLPSVRSIVEGDPDRRPCSDKKGADGPAPGAEARDATRRNHVGPEISGTPSGQATNRESVVRSLGRPTRPTLESASRYFAAQRLQNHQRLKSPATAASRAEDYLAWRLLHESPMPASEPPR